MATLNAITHLVEVMAALRHPETGCPWDIEQSNRSIAPHTIEEAYEVAQAIEEDDWGAIKDELGDLLSNVVYHAQIAQEKGEFSVYDVAQASAEKMIRRHPHVFANEEIRTVEEQKRAWQDLKNDERGGETTSLLDGVPLGMPQLKRGQKIGSKVARVGFDWPDRQGALDKIDEELIELREALDNGSNEQIEEELGDVLFSLCNLARHVKIDAETALLHANDKFSRRFKHLESLAADSQRAVEDLSFVELEQYWQMAKSFTRP